MKDVILRNSRAEQFLCAAKKNFIMRNGVLSESCSKLTICHFSDLHADKARFDNVMEILKYYKPDFAVYTGDLVCWDSKGSDTDFFFETINTLDFPVYNCIGNHETIYGEKTLDNEYLHNRYIKPLKNITTTGKGYYYTDFPEHNLRLIALNVYENDAVERYNEREYEVLQEQCDWLTAALRDCEEKGLGVILMSHEIDNPVLTGSNNAGFCQRYEPHPWGEPKCIEHSIIADIVDAFSNGKSLEKTYKWTKSGNVVDVACDFEKNNEFICYMNGHRHGDYIGYLPQYPKQLSMGVTCAGCFPEGYHNIGDEVSDLPRIPHTVSEDALNFYVIDREKREISVVRVGASVNDMFEERIAAKYRY